MKAYREGATVFRRATYIWLAIATVLVIAGQVVHILGHKADGQALAGYATLFLLAFAAFRLIANELDDTADEIEEVARRISRPLRPAAPRRSRFRFSRNWNSEVQHE